MWFEDRTPTYTHTISVRRLLLWFEDRTHTDMRDGCRCGLRIRHTHTMSLRLLLLWFEDRTHTDTRRLPLWFDGYHIPLVIYNAFYKSIRIHFFPPACAPAREFPLRGAEKSALLLIGKHGARAGDDKQFTEENSTNIDISMVV